ncbi:MAG: hypothetical protein VYE64_08695, partial [Planctomycetota bacterium]|nr:hypothetical protein [Planctomycetota bacterium]
RCTKKLLGVQAGKHSQNWTAGCSFFGWLRLVRAMKATDSEGINLVGSKTSVVMKRIIHMFR